MKSIIHTISVFAAAIALFIAAPYCFLRFVWADAETAFEFWIPMFFTSIVVFGWFSLLEYLTDEG